MCFLPIKYLQKRLWSLNQHSYVLPCLAVVPLSYDSPDPPAGAVTRGIYMYQGLPAELYLFLL